MNIIDIIIVAFVLIISLGVIYNKFFNKRVPANNAGCSGCSSCKHASSCPSHSTNIKKI